MIRPVVLIGLVVVLILEGPATSQQILLLLEHQRLVLILSICVLAACIILLLTIAIIFIAFVFVFTELGILLVDHPVLLGCLHYRASSPVVLEVVHLS